MHPNALAVLACPYCHGPLQFDPDTPRTKQGTLLCTAKGHVFPVVDGVPHLIRKDRKNALGAFADNYGRVWRKDGWGGEDESYILGLPYRDTTGRNAAKWRVKARSMERLLSLLASLRPRSILDLGAGTCWLSHHMARRGFDVYALDVLLTNALGLGAGKAYLRHGPYFARVWGEMERLPFQNGSLDAVVCNASLHYATPLPRVLVEVARVLVPDGVLIVMNSPVHRDRASALKAERDYRRYLTQLGAQEHLASAYHHFVRTDLEGALRQAIGPVAEVPFDPGWAFRWWRRLKGVLLGMELASFPIIMVTRRGPGTSAPRETSTPEIDQEVVPDVAEGEKSLDS